MRYFLGMLVLLMIISCAAAQPLKVATYNIFFLDETIIPERKQHLQKVIAALDADVIGFQEIDSPAGLRNILPGDYELAMLHDPEEIQELALAVRAPLKISSFRAAFPDTVDDDAFPGRRDLLHVNVSGHGKDFVFLVHHAKSRYGGRIETESQRVKGSTMMVEYIKTKLKNENVVLLGDFNDNPDDRSLNILEFGDADASGGIDNHDDTFLFNTTESLLAKDYCSYGYSYIFDAVAKGDTFKLAVEGARAENNNWRDKPHDFRNDVKIKTILIDQILVSLNLKSKVSEVGVFNQTVAIAGKSSRVEMIDGKLQYLERRDLASDHVPVWAVLNLN